MTADPMSGSVTGNLGTVAGTYDLVISGSGNAVAGFNGKLIADGSVEQISIFSTVRPLERQISIPVTSIGPFAVSPNASLIYLVSSDSTTGSPFVISVANLAGTVEQTLNVPQLNTVETPFLAIARDGSALYAGGYLPSTLCKISLPALIVSTCVDVPVVGSLGSTGRTLAISNDGSRLYVITGGYGVLEYDTSSLTVTRTIDPPPEAAGASEVIYSAAANSIYLTYSIPNATGTADQPYVARVDLDTFQIAVTEPTTFTPADIAISPDGSEFVAAGAPYGTVVLNGATFAPERVIPTGLTQSVVVAAQ